MATKKIRSRKTRSGSESKQKNEDSFTLNNDKLCRKLDLKLKKIDVKNYCYELSSKYFK